MPKVLCRTLVLIVTIVQMAGCSPALFLAGGVAGAGGVVWVKGKLTETVRYSLPAVHGATLQAFKGFQLPVEKDVMDTLTARMESRFADGQRLWLALDSLSETSTRISIRCGVFGDKERSHRLLKAIHTHLE